MSLPGSGTLTSAQVQTEYGLSTPWTSATMAAAMGLGASFTSADLYGKSSATLSIGLGVRTQTRVGGSASTRFKATRTLTPNIAGFTASTYAWSLTSQNGLAIVSPATGPTSTVTMTYDINDDPTIDDNGTVYLTIVDTAGVSHSASVAFSL